MKTTILYETWLDGGILRAELVESEDFEPTVLVKTVDGRGVSDVEGHLTLDELLSTPINHPVVVELRSDRSTVGEVTLPYRVIDKALTFLGYEEVF